jgi:hypothetical protein
MVSFRKSCRLWENIGKYVIARLATDNNSKAHAPPPPHTHLLLFHGNSGFTNATRCYVIRTLPLSLIFAISHCSAIYKKHLKYN